MVETRCRHRGRRLNSQCPRSHCLAYTYQATSLQTKLLFFFLFDLDVQHHEHCIVRLKRPPPATLTIVGRFTSANARWSSEESRLSNKLQSWLLLRIGAPCLGLLLQQHLGAITLSQLGQIVKIQARSQALTQTHLATGAQPPKLLKIRGDVRRPFSDITPSRTRRGCTRVRSRLHSTTCSCKRRGERT